MALRSSANNAVKIEKGRKDNNHCEGTLAASEKDEDCQTANSVQNGLWSVCIHFKHIYFKQNKLQRTQYFCATINKSPC
jgi:hypothetical protein